jgi:SAM-dependent methyltransferase
VLTPARPDTFAYKMHSALNSLRQRRCRGEIDHVYQRTLATLDQRAFSDHFSHYRSSSSRTRGAKYLDVNGWLRQAADRYLLTGLARLPKNRRVLDLGSGPGYFALICRTEGHHPLALDVDDDPLYAELTRYFNLPFVIHRIEPKRPLPSAGGPFDLITAFRSCFDVKADGSPWDGEDWEFLLRDLRSQLTPNGRVVLGFNVNPKTGTFYSPTAAAVFRRPPGYESRLFFEYAFFSRTG